VHKLYHLSAPADIRPKRERFAATGVELLGNLSQRWFITDTNKCDLGAFTGKG
jgi:hypothetical protein